MIELRTVPFDATEAAALAERLEAELLGIYDGVPGSGGLPSPELFTPPAGAFVVAAEDGAAVGCGGLARLDAVTGEVRRMYVAPEARGRGLGRILLAELERLAADAGYLRVRMETGDRQPEAVALYERAGYRRIERWGPFEADPRSICLEKTLTVDPGEPD